MTTAILGMVFALLGFAAMFLMMHLWGYRFDKETGKSEAPRWAMYIHRGLGYAYALCYVLLMWQMMPRLWQYQVEFPARTVAHIILGFSIGFILVLKISIMRFFRHFEEWMPFLGTVMVLFTVLLLGLSMPFAVQESRMAQRAMTAKNRARVLRVLPRAGLPKQANIKQLASKSSLYKGRRVLLKKCILCHDLRTVIARPRSPKVWYRTVVRMAKKPTLFDRIDRDEQWQVTAYLVAISDALQDSASTKAKDEEKQNAKKKQMLEAAREPAPAEAPNYDKAVVKKLYEEECTLCHELDKPNVTKGLAEVKTVADVDKLIQRMIDNDLELDPLPLKQIRWYLKRTLVKQ